MGGDDRLASEKKNDERRRDKGEEGEGEGTHRGAAGFGLERVGVGVAQGVGDKGRDHDVTATDYRELVG